MDEPRVKGATFRSVDECFTEMFGAEAHARALALMQTPVREAYRNGLVLASSWYPISWYRDVFQAFRQVNRDGIELSRKIGYCSARREMRGIYKSVLVKIVSPQALLGLSAFLFNMYYDTGKFDIVESRRGFARAFVHGCTGWDANMWADLMGGVTGLLELSGARNVQLSVLAGTQDGDTDSTFEAFWRLRPSVPPA